MTGDESASLWRLEEQFWMGSAEFYASTLAPSALMVLPPPAGVLDRAATIEAIREGQRWRSVSFDQPHCIFPAAGSAVLAYLAHADRGGSAYAARCSSAYVQHQGRWLLAVHHQSPVSGS